MRKFFFMLATGLIGFAAHATDYYLVGGFNDWGQKDSNYKFTQVSDNDSWYSYAYIGKFDNDTEFKLMNSDDSWYGGYSSSISVSGYTYNLTGSANATLEKTVNNPVFFFKPSSSTVRVVSVPSALYLVGKVNDTNWDTTTAVAMEKDGNKFTATNVAIDGNFTLISALGSSSDDWTTPNASDRFGAASASETLTAGQASNVTCYPKDINSSSAKNWNLEAGTYDITVDFDGATGIEITATAVEPAVVNYAYQLNASIFSITADDWSFQNMTEQDGKWAITVHTCYPGKFGIKKVVEGSDYQKDYIYASADATVDGSAELEAVLESEVSGGHNWELTSAGEYTFTFDPETMTLSVVKAQLDEPFTVYFQVPDGWTAANIWAYGDGREGQFFCETAAGWPGDAMTLVPGYTNTYVWSTTRGVPTKLIFSKGGNDQIDTFKNDNSDYTFESGHLFTSTEYSQELFTSAYQYGNVSYGSLSRDDNRLDIDYELIANEDGTLTIRAKYEGDALAEYHVLNTTTGKWINLAADSEGYYEGTSEDIFSLGDELKLNFHTVILGIGELREMYVTYKFGEAQAKDTTSKLNVTASVSDITSNSASIAWTVKAKNYTGAYTVYLVDSNDQKTELTESPYTITGLNASTAYTFTVEACGDNDLKGSAEVSFTTNEENATAKVWYTTVTATLPGAYLKGESSDNARDITVYADVEVSFFNGKLTVTVDSEETANIGDLGFQLRVADAFVGFTYNSDTKLYTATANGDFTAGDVLSNNFGLFYAYPGQGVTVLITDANDGSFYTVGATNEKSIDSKLNVSASVSDITANSATIAWSVSPKNYTGSYSVYLVDSNNEKTELTESPYTITGLNASTAYTFTVEACGDNDLKSSAEVSFTTNEENATAKVWYTTVTATLPGAYLKGESSDNARDITVYADVEVSFFNGKLTVTVDSEETANIGDLGFQLRVADAFVGFTYNSDTKLYTATANGDFTAGDVLSNNFGLFYAYPGQGVTVLITDANDGSFYTVGATNEKPSKTPVLTLNSASAQKITSNSAEIAFDVTAAFCSYNVIVKGNGNEYTTESSPLKIENLEANTEYTFTVQAVATDTELSSESIEVTFTTLAEGQVEAGTFSGQIFSTEEIGDTKYDVLAEYTIKAVGSKLQFNVSFTYQQGLAFDAPRVVVTYYKDGNLNGDEVVNLTASSASNTRAMAATSTTTVNSGELTGTSTRELANGDQLKIDLVFSRQNGIYSQTVNEYTTYGVEGVSSINSVAVDNADAPVEYYNLQGVKVMGEPAPGLYIRRQGNKASKVVIR